MQARGLDAVCAPTVVEDLVRDTVLVTEWVDGTRLDRDASPDVPRLCGVAINAYLTMLLDTGCLHCDPHPGNLLRTTDGKLCILDWGMTLSVPSDLQYALLELYAPARRPPCHCCWGAWGSQHDGAVLLAALSDVG
jgi:predicted unusual protein kinase regulating ubiquinone biosynthesis (AarF/ABC1/UbiB family)